MAEENIAEEIAQLRRENQELKAENERLPGLLEDALRANKRQAALFFAIILSGSEINSLQDFLNLQLWYHFPMFCFLRLWFGAMSQAFSFTARPAS